MLSMAVVIVFAVIIIGAVLATVYTSGPKSGSAKGSTGGGVSSSSTTSESTTSDSTFSESTSSTPSVETTFSSTAWSSLASTFSTSEADSTDEQTTEITSSLVSTSSEPAPRPPTTPIYAPVNNPPAPVLPVLPNPGPANGSSPVTGCPLWGLTYSPYNTDGSCPDVNTVAAQLQKVAQATGHIRLYSSDCSQLSSVLQAITRDKIALDVYAGIWLAAGPSRMQADLDQFVAAAKTFGTGLIKGLSVGNEDINNGMSEATLIGYINQVRARLQAEGLGGIPVYTTEQDAKFSQAMAAVSDVVEINVHTIFDGYFANMDASVQSVIQRANHIKNNVAGGKKVRIGETGWASAGNTGPSPLTLANEIAYAQKFKCAAAAAGFEYFYFEAKDAQWKAGAVLSEQNFGIFNAGFTPKFDFGLLNNC
ncbi:hypothetical protein GGI06_001913 [Coemansia sp. S85]|nr:hypothetical protein GGI06_001913 [Coemansia sp. S85]